MLPFLRHQLESHHHWTWEKTTEWKKIRLEYKNTTASRIAKPISATTRTERERVENNGDRKSATEYPLSGKTKSHTNVMGERW